MGIGRLKTWILSFLAAGLALSSAPCAAQVWTYFPPPGMSYNSTTELFSLGSTSSGVTPYRYLVDGKVGDLTDGHASANFQGALNVLEYVLAPDSLTPQTQGLGDYFDIWRATASGNCQQGVSINAWYPCRITLGTNTSSYAGAGGLGCQEIIGPLNPPLNGGSHDLGFRLRCMDNDSAGFLAGSHNSGTESYGWTYFYSGGSFQSRYGTSTEHVASTTTAAANAQRAPHCTGALNATITGQFLTSSTLTVNTITSGTIAVGQTVVLPGLTPSAYIITAFGTGSGGTGTYTTAEACSGSCGSVTPVAGTTYNPLPIPNECWMTSPGALTWQVSDGGNSSDNGGPLNGTTFLGVTKASTVNEAKITLGDSANSTSFVNIVSPTAANAQANGSQILTLASGGNITVPPTISSQAICLANGTNCPVSGPAGSTGQYQYNNAGVLAGDPTLTTNGNNSLTLGTNGSSIVSITGKQVSGTGNGAALQVFGQNGGTISGNSGNVSFNTATPVEGVSGNANWFTGNGASLIGSARNSGTITFRTGVPANAGASGAITLQTGIPTGGGSSGALTIESGNETNATSGNTGQVVVISGNSTAGSSGSLLIGSGSAGAGTPGPVSIQVNASTVAQFTKGGHVNYTSSSPAVSACGTSPSIDAHATDNSGTVTVGTIAAASCTLTFATAFTTWNHCRVTSQSVIASFAYSYTLSTITVTGTSLVGDLFDYECDGL